MQRGRKQITYDSTWHVQFRTISTRVSDSHRHGGGWSELPGHTRNGYFRGCHETTIYLGFSGWNIVRRWVRNHPTPPVHAATECFAEKSDTVCIPSHSEVMLWAKLKTNNGRRGPTAGVVLALQTFVQEFGILVGRSLVCADADDWKVPILLYNSDPCTNKSKDCKCNPVIIPARTRIACVEEIQAIQNIGTRETERSAGECRLPPHLLDVLDAASELTSDQHARAANLLAKHIHTFPAPGTPITGRTEAVVHDIDTGSRPIRCNPRKLAQEN